MAHKYSDGEFGDGLWSALAGAAIIGSVVMGYVQGVGPLLDMLFHSQLLTAIHWLVRGVQEMWEGINGPLTSRDRVWFDIALLLGDVAVFVLGLIDGWRAFTGVKIGKYAGQGPWVRLQRIFLKLKNFIQHGLNVDALKPLLGDIGALIGGIPTMIKDWNTFARDARSAWGWNLERMPCTNVICS